MDSLSSKVKDIDGPVLKSCLKKGLDDGLKHAKHQEQKVQTGTHDHVSTVTYASHARDMDSYANKLAEGSKKGIKFRLMDDVAKMDNGESSSSQQGREKDYDGDSDVEVIYDEMEQSLKDNIGVVNEKRHDLEELQEQIDKNPFDESLREMEARCMRDFETAALDEEQFMKQKSKIEWLSAGDSNSAYFHRALKSKINKGRINSIVDSGGIFLQHDEVPDAFVNHYKVFLGSESSSVIVNRLNIFTSHLNSDTADVMNVEGSWEDIRHQIHSQLKLKSARSIIERLVIGAASYYVWQERNARLFQNEVRSANQLSKVIIKTVHFRLQTIRFKGTRGNKQVLDRWNIKADMQMEDKDNG
ncbi:hypothetical protein QVD17_06849 [Tagetes erecta]|uniref:Uncharacterized protein n=1 Tax=Tagetes erecta TaxID=13708 RepID=A0AAD8LGR4_TARER|nr:hypothetical protein QVD17_06849 [Tagetes erecta]